MDEEQELPTMSTRIRCQVTGCDYVAEHTSENVAIALLTSHGQNHKKSKQKAQIDRPECKQDISIEEWQEFESDWSRFKRSHDVDDDNKDLEMARHPAHHAQDRKNLSP